MTHQSEFRAAAAQVVVRGIVLLVLFIIGAVLAFLTRGEFRPYHIGSKAIAYDQRAARVVKPGEHITVLSTALEDGRGLVALPCNGDAGARCIPNALLGPAQEAGAKEQSRGDPLPADCDTQAVIADAWDALLVLCVRRLEAQPASSRMVAFVRERWQGSDVLKAAEERAFLPRSRTGICPDSQCAPVEHAGLASTGTSLLFVEPHNQRLTELRFAGDPALPPSRAIYNAPANVRLHDVVFAGGRFVVSTSQAGDGSGAAMQIGAVGTAADAPAEGRALAGLGTPLGIAHSSTPDRERFYVADLVGDVLRWSYREQAGAVMGPQKTFWTMKVGKVRPPLLHMVTEFVPGLGEVVFAGGPDGLYIFQPDEGTLLAKYVLDRPVLGLSWGKTGELFMTAGRYLCVLKTLPPSPGAGGARH